MSKMIATLEVVLLDFDGPQVILLNRGKRKIIGVAIPEYRDFEFPFFCSAIKEASFEKYLDGRADLRYLFDTAFREKYYFIDFNKNEHMPLNVASEADREDEKHWPKVGFFSRSHSTEYRVNTAEQAVKKFDIDGSWDARDFAKFNNKLADLYAICDLINKQSDQIKSANFKKTISDQNFESGGSYGALYNRIKASAASLRLKEVKYASPGHISMAGNKAALAEISDIISSFDGEFDTIEQNSKALETLLKKEQLLSASPETRFQSEYSRNLANDFAEELYSSMGLDDVDWIKGRCGNNTLVFAKLVRSIYKRALALWTYRREGRLQEMEFVS